MAEVKELVVGIPKPLAEKMAEPTPEEFIKQRKGRGGLTFNYVETGYVVMKLNELFNGMWDFEIDDQAVGGGQVWVKGKLTIKLSPELFITKTQYGGSHIKKHESGDPIDIADDLKAAGSDSLKKCASLLGIASDVYFPQRNGQENSASPPATVSQKALIMKMTGEKTNLEAEAHVNEFLADIKAKPTFKWETVTKNQASWLIDKMIKSKEEEKEEEIPEGAEEVVAANELPF